MLPGIYYTGYIRKDEVADLTSRATNDLTTRVYLQYKIRRISSCFVFCMTLHIEKICYKLFVYVFINQYNMYVLGYEGLTYYTVQADKRPYHTHKINDVIKQSFCQISRLTKVHQLN